MATTTNITILRGVEDWYRAVKTFRLGPDGVPVKVSDFQLGKHFNWRELPLRSGQELIDLQQVINRCGPRSFRVYGRVKDEHRELEQIERNSEFIEEPTGGIQLLELDVDGWESPVPWNWTDHKSVRLVLFAAMQQRGLEWMTEYDYLVMWSSSSWEAGGLLKCHLYWWLDQPIPLERLREWALAFNLVAGTKVMDSSCWRAVQPDYLARRVCVDGLEDPVPPEYRTLLLRGTELSGNLPLEELQKVIDRDLLAAGFTPNNVRGGSVSPFALGKTWNETLRKAGVSGEINEWCYRAAAQVVQANGRARTLANLDQMARDMHAIAWQYIGVNSQGARGGESDRQTYTIARFKQYLKSACDRKFGDECDLKASLIQEAIERAKQGEIARMSDPDVLSAAKTLMTRWAGRWDEIRAQVKRELRDLSVIEWVQRVRGTAPDTVAPTSNPLMEGDTPAFTGDTFTGSGGGLNEVAFVNAIIRSYKWYTWEGARYSLDALESRKDGGYTLRSVADSMVDSLWLRGTELVGGQINISLEIGRKALIVANSMTSCKTRPVATRYWHDPRDLQSNIWWNLGVVDGQYCCLRIKSDGSGSEKMSWRDSLKHKDAPLWLVRDTASFGGTQPLYAGSNGPTNLSAEVLENAADGPGLLDAPWVKKLFTYILVEDPYEQSNVVCWLTGILMNAPMAGVLQIIGGPGEGKTMAGRFLCNLLEPGFLVESPLGFDTSMLSKAALVPAVAGQTVVFIDNLTSLTGSRQDRLCRLTTGMTERVRILYTNQWIDYSVKTAVVTTGVGPCVTRPDLLDRAFTVEVRFRSGSDANVIGRWYQDRSEIVEGFISLVGGLAAMQGKLTGDRGSLQRLVRQVMLGAEFDAAETGSNIAKSVELITRDLFISAFCAFLAAERPEGFFTSGEILKEYSAWARANLGRVIEYRDAGGGMQEVKLTGHSGLKELVPRTPHALGRKLAMFQRNIYRMTNVMVEPARNKLSRGWQINYKNETEI